MSQDWHFADDLNLSLLNIKTLLSSIVDMIGVDDLAPQVVKHQ